ncbi:MAG: YkoF family thiamine/hydroxymethylpyrimidine-binding protein [Kangiellaceae bacterium]|jgi:uncharacterized protein YqgV (UPF0045/DUF77 family)|nr:YkoF family thiamine/hydroxymethylpyrimidine-binding protein [Kangiellaceae bacterium]
MKLAVEMSLYPLSDDYIPDIQGFIDRLNQYSAITVVTNAMSTQVCGDYDDVMAMLTTELKPEMEQQRKVVLVCKFLNSDIFAE